MPAWDDSNLDDALEWITVRVLDEVGAHETVPAVALLFLLRRFVASGRDDLGDALGHALAAAMAAPGLRALDERSEWLTLYAEASAISDDERLRTAAIELVASLRADWPAETRLDGLMTSVEACLAADACVSNEPHGQQDLVPAAVQELERGISATYRPGAGVGHSLSDPDSGRGALGDQIGAASALLAAYLRTGRLPYSMLAEELMRSVRRTLWDDRLGGFFSDGSSVDQPDKPFVLNCRAARVFCRLALLHRDEDYRHAVAAPDLDYADAARQTLLAQAPDVRLRGLGAAIFGVALTEFRVL